MIRPASSLLAIAACVATAAPALADRYPLQPGLEVRDYAFDLILPDDGDDLRVEEAVEVSFAADGLRAVDLDLCNVVTAATRPDPLDPCQAAPRQGRPAAAQAGATPASLGKGMTMLSADLDGRPLRFEHSGNRLRLFLPAPSRKGQRARIGLSYHGVPAAGLFIGKNAHGDRVFFSDNWPNRARDWLATVDHVSVKSPKTMTVTAPARYQVISNGLKTGEVDLGGGLRRTTWREAVPIPSWQFSLGAAPMAVTRLGERDGVEFSAWLAPQNGTADLGQIAATNLRAFDFYSGYVGPFAFEKLAHVEAAGGQGAMELATSIFYFGDLGAMPHEMAHQWFGNAVTEANWDDVWLSEGFATYFSLLFTEHDQGRDAFLKALRRTRDGAVKYALAHPESTIVHRDLDNDSKVLNNAPQIYSGGAMVLHTLRGVVGDGIFRAGIRQYYARHLNRSATTDDFRMAIEDACRAAAKCPADLSDLSWFFDQWLRRGGLPRVQGNWRYDPARKMLDVTLAQTQQQDLFRLPTELEVTLSGTAPAPQTTPGAGQGEVKRFKLVIDARRTAVSFPLEAEPVDVKLDPDGWTPMMQATLEKGG